jgi:aminoglycoside phosphotransferase (APT) family kinase protein
VIAAGDERVRAALRRVWPDARTVDTAQIRALGGGLNARSFLVVAGERRHVLRLPLKVAVAALDLASEARAMHAAAAVDLAPAVIAVDIEAGLLLTEYCAGPLTAEYVRQPAIITMIVRSLRALHQLRVELPVYSVRTFAATYLAALRAGATRVLSAEEQRWADELTRLAHHFDESYAPTAFCHTDLVAANILTDGATARLIDFEYAGLGAPLLDLASVAGMNDFASAQRQHLLDAYYGAGGDAPTMRDLDSAVRMVRLLAYFWGRMAEERLQGAAAHAKLAENIGATLRQG